MEEKVCGVYGIINIKNNKIYIGSSNDIYYRWKTHKLLLSRNSHDNIYLQSDWNLYSEDNFIFEIIEYCDKETKLQKEQYYIIKYNSLDRQYGYNINNAYSQSGLYSSQNKKGYNTNSSHRKYSEAQVKRVIRLLLDSDISYNRIAELTNTSFRLVSDIYSKNSWLYLTNGIVFPRRTKKINEYQANEVNKLLQLGYKDTDISKKTNIPISIIQSIRLGISWKNKKTNRLSKEDIINIINDYNNGMSIMKLSVKYNFSYNQIYKMLNRETWNDLTKDLFIKGDKNNAEL